MAVSGWGGGIEMAACSHLKRVNVHVYERSTYGTYKRISCFDYDNGARATVCPPALSLPPHFPLLILISVCIIFSYLPACL